MHLILYAPSVTVGGGLTLLTALLEALRDDPVPWSRVAAVVDSRLAARLAPGRLVLYAARAGLLGRIAAERLLVRLAPDADLVLCFGSLPPLWRLQAPVATYVQNTYVFGPDRGVDLPWPRRLRRRAMALWFRTWLPHADVHVVQTPTLRDRMCERFGLPRERILVAPFRADGAAAPGAPRTAEWDFVYVSDGEAHKNHRRLIDAFRLLAERGVRPSLAVTVPPARYPALARWMDQARRVHGLRITNLGDVPHARIGEVYAAAGALIFPSLSETVGLPLLEAGRHRLPILASERDYVRDVVEPSDTFDPESPRSIMRAVLRHLGTPEAPVAMQAPAAFAAQLAERLVRPRPAASGASLASRA
jgi:glycosyltransferase involved in cell wall biosynthesis